MSQCEWPFQTSGRTLRPFLALIMLNFVATLLHFPGCNTVMATPGRPGCKVSPKQLSCSKTRPVIVYRGNPSALRCQLGSPTPPKRGRSTELKNLPGNSKVFCGSIISFMLFVSCYGLFFRGCKAALCVLRLEWLKWERRDL